MGLGMEIGSNGYQAGQKELGFGNRGLAFSFWDLIHDRSLWRRKKIGEAGSGLDGSGPEL
jgi:hypothetical protein